MKSFARVSLAVLVGLAVLSPASAHAAADQTPPKLTLERFPHYKAGSTMYTDWYTADPGFVEIEEWGVDYQFKWTVSDPSGICSQRITEQGYETLGGPSDPVLGDNTETFTVAASARSYSYSEDGADWERNGDRFVVRSTDCAGNTATSTITTTMFGIAEDRSGQVAYVGTWKTSNFAGFSGGTTHSTSVAGNSASFTVAGPGPVGLVMEKAADRGKADVYVDGIKKATIDTHATKTAHCQVVWQAMLGAGSHTIKIVNLATAGHPRIDLDAALIPSGEYY
jgi:hypothetical protein